ncbi:hypothetical protein R3P38DRAFT_3241878 [Favolaschia claudopus]|uniref:Uncharacterized protein n=1 Tax=Favolaschia claudopus TaxID=2862362 RepID=A0AAV9Z5A3_9AGAR
MFNAVDSSHDDGFGARQYIWSGEDQRVGVTEFRWSRSGTKSGCREGRFPSNSWSKNSEQSIRRLQQNILVPAFAVTPNPSPTPTPTPFSTFLKLSTVGNIIRRPCVQIQSALVHPNDHIAQARCPEFQHTLAYYGTMAG